MPEPQPTSARPSFPPAPWRLRGELVVSAWLVPARALAAEAPDGWRPLGLFGRRLVGTFVAEYGQGGDLAYRELALGLAVRRGLRLAVTIPWIWVDDPAAQAGGRELWAIPKRLASFRDAGGRIEAEEPGGAPVAAAWTGAQLVLPGRWPFAFHVVQPAPEGVRLTRARIAGEVRLVRAAWRGFGPLALLTGRRPLLSLRVEAAQLVFGGPEA